MRQQAGKIGSIRRELEGKACPSCGWMKYQPFSDARQEPGKAVSTPDAATARGRGTLMTRA